MGKSRDLANLVSKDMMSIDASGNIGINRSEPIKKLDISGTVSSTSLGGGTWDVPITGTTNSASSLTSTGTLTVSGQLNGDGSALVGVAYTAVAIIGTNKGYNVDGGEASSTDTWLNADLAGILDDRHSIVKDLTGNVITLRRGIYTIGWVVQGIESSHLGTRLLEDGTVVAVGTQEFSRGASAYASAVPQGVSDLRRITSDTEYKVQYIRTSRGDYYDLGLAHDGMGSLGSSDPNHYSLCYILKGNY